MCDYILVIRAVQRTRKHSTSQKCSGYERIENTAGLAETERDSSGIATKSNGQCGVLDWVSGGNGDGI